MKYLFLIIGGLATSVFLTPAITAQEAEERENIMVVLDASGSMWGQIEGRAKIEIIREAYGKMVVDWEKEKVQSGLIAYGHRRKGDCSDIEILSKPGQSDSHSLGRAAYKLTPKGKTPLGAAVRMAAEELKYTEQKATVILLSDGVETCGVDPCQLGHDLENLGVDFTANVIGFDIKSKQDKAQLQCLAENTGGRFVTASNAAELQKAVEATSYPGDLFDEDQRNEEYPGDLFIHGLLTDTGEPAPGRVKWELRSDDELYTLESETSRLDLGRLLDTELQPGDFTITGYFGAYAGSENFTLPTKETEIRVNLRRDVPETAFEIDEDIFVASEFLVSWTGKGGDEDQIVIFAPNSDIPLARAFVKDGNPLTLVAPDQSGPYELAYLSDGQLRRVDGRMVIQVRDSVLSLSPVGEIRAGQDFKVQWSGPGAENQRIAIGPRTGGEYDYSSNVLASEGNPAVLSAPSEPGEYELRYYSEGFEILHSEPVIVR